MLENIHPSQEGVYQCLAENKIGRVTAEARVTVRERPVLTVTPETRVQVSLHSPLSTSHIRHQSQNCQSDSLASLKFLLLT